MKKFLSSAIALILTLQFAFILSACSQKKAENKDSGKISVVATIFPYYDYVRNVAGERADITLLLSPGSEPHSYEPSPSDIVAIENCDIFIYNGGESDEWVEGVLESLQNKDMKIMKMMDYADLLYEQSPGSSHSVSREHNHVHESGDEYDEHIWTSVRNAEKLSDAIGGALSECDPQNKGVYEKNAENYCERLLALDKKFINIVQNGKKDAVVFGDRFPFLYFVTDYDLDYECAFPGCSSETEPSIATVTHLIDFAREEDVSVVFYLEFSNGKVANLIAEDTGAKTLQFSSCHNVTKDDFENGVSYISLMEQNAKSLEEALA